jgi:hypothetical protein
MSESPIGPIDVVAGISAPKRRAERCLFTRESLAGGDSPSVMLAPEHVNAARSDEVMGGTVNDFDDHARASGAYGQESGSDHEPDSVRKSS